MASSSTNKTIWTVALIAVFGFLAFKLLPGLLKKLGSSDSNGGGGSNSVGGVSYYPPDYGQGQGQGGGQSAGLNLGGNGSQQGSSLNPGGILSNFLNQVNGYNASTMGYFNSQNTSLDYQEQPSEDTVGPFTTGTFSDLLSSWDAATGQYSLQNMDLQSFSPDDPNAPWNDGGSGSGGGLSTTEYTGPDSISGGDSSGGSFAGGSGGGSGGGGGSNDVNLQGGNGS